MWATLSGYLSGFLVATFKFLLSPFILLGTDLSFLEIFISITLGALVSFNVFYWSSSYFMKLAAKKRAEKRLKPDYVPKKAFTKTNKFIVRVKRSKFGYIGLLILGPTFLSIPLGTVIVAKFYSDRPKTYWLAMINLVCWGLVLTSVGYLIKHGL